MRMEDFALAMVESSRVLAFDTETTGLDPHGAEVCGWVVANAEHEVYVPVRHTGGGNISDVPRFERKLALAFAKRSRLGLRTIGFALHFDLWFAGKHGVILRGPLEDCQLNAVLIRDNLGRAYDLNSCAKRCEVPGKSEEGLYEVLFPIANELRRKEGKKARKEPSRDDMIAFHMLPGTHPLAVEYAEGDGRVTFNLWKAQQPLLDLELGGGESLRRVWQLECDLLPRVAAMRRRGLKVDTDYGKKARDLIREAKEEKRKAMNVPADFKSKAPQQVAEWLFAQGVPHLPKTPTGKFSTRKSILERIEAGRRVLDLRDMETAESSFVNPLLTTHLNDGRVHPELVQSANGQYGTHTGRFSSREPNMQAYPKRKKHLGLIVRPLIVADEGMLIGEADVSQQEPRMYAHIAQEPRLLKGYNSTPHVDVHTITSQLLGLDRDTSKTLGLSLFNGMGVNALAERMNIDPPTARKLRWGFFETYPEIYKFTEEAPKIARRGYVRTILGRRAWFNENTHMAVSRVIQGSAADQMKILLLQGLQYCESDPRIEILMTIHDSVLFQCQIGTDLKDFRSAIEDMSNLYQMIGSRRVPMRVPFPVEIGLGRNWAEASYGKKS